MTDPGASTARLYEQVGGRETVSAIVEAFYQRVEGDEHLRPVYPEDLAPGKEKLKLFFEEWLGGPRAYSSRYGHPRLRRRHFPFVIDEKAAGRWLRYMREAWQESGVDPDIQAAVFESLGPLARHMVNADLDVPREPLGEAFLQ
ncbi:MAG: globin [Dehalococcoidia bacterium]|nr:globin [Dehalococcoidia bacterium]